MVHLRRNTEYGVKVRAIPHKHLQGTWSEWSEPFSFITPDTATGKWKLVTLKKEDNNSII